jgi:hypothetical protein
MARTDDRTRILNLLSEAEGGLSNQRIRTELRLGRERYEETRTQLIGAGEVEKYVCRGGGIRVTDKGAVGVSVAAPAVAPLQRPAGAEARLYPILVQQLTRENDESVLAHHFIPASLKHRGQWRNPDVVTIEVVPYPRLQRLDVLVWTYEVKPRDCWEVKAVYEAERHKRSSCGSTLVLEGPAGASVDEDPRLREIRDECRHHGVSLAILQTGKEAGLTYLHDEEPHSPDPAVLHNWLDYTLIKMPEVAAKFDELMSRGNKRVSASPRNSR